MCVGGIVYVFSWGFCCRNVFRLDFVSKTRYILQFSTAVKTTIHVMALFCYINSDLNSKPTIDSFYVEQVLFYVIV